MTIVTFIVPRGYRPDAGVVFAETGAVEDCDTPGGTGPCPGNDDPDCPDVGDPCGDSWKEWLPGEGIDPSTISGPTAVPVGTGGHVYSVSPSDNDSYNVRQKTYADEVGCPCTGDAITVDTGSESDGNLWASWNSSMSHTEVDDLSAEFAAPTTSGQYTISATIHNTDPPEITQPNTGTRADSSQAIPAITVDVVAVTSIALTSPSEKNIGDQITKDDLSITTDPEGHEDLVEFESISIGVGPNYLVAYCGISSAATTIYGVIMAGEWSELTIGSDDQPDSASFTGMITGLDGKIGITLGEDSVEEDLTDGVASTIHIEIDVPDGASGEAEPPPTALRKRIEGQRRYTTSIEGSMASLTSIPIVDAELNAAAPVLVALVKYGVIPAGSAVAGAAVAWYAAQYTDSPGSKSRDSKELFVHTTATGVWSKQSAKAMATYGQGGMARYWRGERKYIYVPSCSVSVAVPVPEVVHLLADETVQTWMKTRAITAVADPTHPLYDNPGSEVGSTAAGRVSTNPKKHADDLTTVMSAWLIGESTWTEPLDIEDCTITW